MLFFKKFSIYLFSLANLSLFYLLFKRPAYMPHLILGCGGLLLLTHLVVIGRKMSTKEFLLFFGFVLILTLSAILFLLVIENIWLKGISIIILAGLDFLYLQLIFSYLYSPHRYQPFSLVNFFNYSSLLSLFFTACGLYALQIFLTLNFWLLAGILAGLSLILIWYNFWINKIEKPKTTYFKYLAIVLFLTFQLAVLLIWWPINYYLRGFLLAAFYYLFNNLSLAHLKSNINKKSNLIQIVGILILVIISLITTRWM